jgi:hypothetical protein
MKSPSARPKAVNAHGQKAGTASLSMAFLEFGEEVIARMSDFAKPLSDGDFNYLRIADSATWPNAKRFLSVPHCRFLTLC